MIALDTETTGTNVRKDKVIGFSMYDGKESVYITHLQWNGSELVEVVPKATCVDLLNGIKSKKLIFHNSPFDVQIIKNYFGVDLVDSIHADTTMLAHTLNENETVYGLKELSAKYLGADSRAEQEELKKYLGKDRAFYKVPAEVLAKYAKKDAELTWRLFHLYSRQLTSSLKTLFYEEIMPLQKLVIIPMMQRGVRVDEPKLRKAFAEITVDVERFKSELLAEIAPVTETFYSWYYAKNYPLKSRGLVFDKMKSGLSLRAAQEAVAREKGDEGFNIQSRYHLGDLFFKIFKMEPISRTEKGAPQVNEDFLEYASEIYPWVKNLIVFNKLMKIKSSYYERILRDSEHSIFYPDYFLHRTVSGRMSGDFQQLPKPLEGDEKWLLRHSKYSQDLLVKYTNQVREFFISRPGYILIDDDFDSLEPRIFAAVAGDEALIDIFKKGHDFYSTIAIMVEKLQDVSADKKADNYLGKVKKSARQTSKSYSLGIAYGEDDYKLHKDLGIPQAEAKRLVNGYFAAFPNLAESMKNVRKSILETGLVSTRFGRLRRQPEIPKLFQKHGSAILNALELWKKYNEVPGIYAQAKKDYKVVRHAINNAYNHRIQGLAGHVLNRAAIAIAKEIKGLDAYIIGAVHDELILECNETIRDQVAEIIERCMETTTILETPLVAKPSFGYDLRSAKQ